MPLLQLLFSFEGRINRLQFRQGGSIAGLIAGAVFSASLAAVGPLEDRAKVVALLAIGIALLCFILWSNAALQAKRLHDRGHSGFLALISVFVFLAWASVAGYIGSVTLLGADGAPPKNLDWVQEGGQTLIALSGLSLIVSFWVFIDLGLLPGTPGPNQFGPEPGSPGGRPQAPGGGSPAAPRKSWINPKPKAHAWDVSGAEAAIAQALAERKGKGATLASESPEAKSRSGFSNPASGAAFGRRK